MTYVGPIDYALYCVLLYSFATSVKESSWNVVTLNVNVVVEKKSEKCLIVVDMASWFFSEVSCWGINIEFIWTYGGLSIYFHSIYVWGCTTFDRNGDIHVTIEADWWNVINFKMGFKCTRSLIVNHLLTSWQTMLGFCRMTSSTRMRMCQFITNGGFDDIKVVEVGR